MQDNSRDITFVDENGKEVKAEVILTYHSDEFKHDYVIFCIKGQDTASAAIFHETGANDGELEPITDDKEWAMLEEVLAAYYEDATVEDDGSYGCNGGCAGCNGNCDCEGEDDGSAGCSGCNCGKK